MKSACKGFFILFVGYMQCAAGGESQVVPLGEYANIHATKSDHCYGYHAKLWQHNRSFVGFFSHSESLCGDTPTGLLENVKYDSVTKKLSFTTRISTGCIFTVKDECVRSIEVIRFTGQLTKAGLAGTATWYDKDGKESGQKDNLHLKKVCAPAIQPYKNLGEWEADLRDVLVKAPAR